jgi:hypothetical protein
VKALRMRQHAPTTAQLTVAQAADVVWHWGPDGSGDLQGFLRSESHFSSTCLDQWNSGPAPTCHIIGDVGGDLVFGALKLAGNVQTWTWAVPVADVVAVYRRMGSAFDFVTPEAVTHCLKLLYAGRAAVWSVGDAAVPHFSSHAAFMEQELHDFVYGGHEDMAMQTAVAWAQLVQVLRGRQPIPPPFNPPSQPASFHAPCTSAAAPPPPPSWVHDLQPVLSARLRQRCKKLVHWFGRVEQRSGSKWALASAQAARLLLLYPRANFALFGAVGHSRRLPASD